MTASVVILPDTTGQLSAIGTPFRVTSFNNFYTVAIYVSNFTGSVYIEASLAHHPEEHDWFPINLNGNIAAATFPMNPMHPTGAPGIAGRGGFQDTNTAIPIGDSGIASYSFEVNALWLRARVDRSFIQPPPTNIFQVQAFGNVEQVILGY